MTSLRVLLLTHSHPRHGRGGVETFSRDLVRVFPGLEILAAESLPDDLSRGRLRELRRLRALAEAAVRRHRERPYDLIIANGSLAKALPRPLPVHPAPVVVVMHGNYAGYARRAMSRVSWKTLYTRLVAARWERASVQRADAVVGVSACVAEDVRKYYARPAIAIQNGVRLPANPIDRDAARTRIELSLGRPLVAFVGRATREKGYDRLLRLARDRAGIDFVAATPTPPGRVPANLRAFVDPEPELLSSIYAAADLLFFPSRFEGCAYAPLEAMSFGIPVVTSATGAFSGGAGPFAGGWIVDNPRHKNWCAAVDEVLQCRHHFAPREYVGSRFSFKDFSAAYRRLASGLVPGAFGSRFDQDRLAAPNSDGDVREVRVA